MTTIRGSVPVADLHARLGDSAGVASAALSEFSPGLLAWLRNLLELNRAPIPYLIPTEQLLPAESLRFFYLDPLWMDALLDGALSPGRTTQGAAAHLEAHRELVGQALDLPRPATGFLLRSAVVSAWTDLETEARDGAGQALAPIRLERLSANILLGLYPGVVRRLILHQPAESLHLGFDESENGALFKILRSIGRASRASGAELHDVEPLAPAWRPGERRTLKVADLARAAQARLQSAGELNPGETLKADQFALTMIEGVGRVEFKFDL